MNAKKLTRSVESNQSDVDVLKREYASPKHGCRFVWFRSFQVVLVEKLSHFGIAVKYGCVRVRGIEDDCIMESSLDHADSKTECLEKIDKNDRELALLGKR